MITRPVLSRAIGRLRLMAMFPGSDSDVLAALGAELVDLCEDDAAVKELVGEIVRNQEQWPGIKRLRETAAEIAYERTAKENTKQNWAQCRDHEVSCPGYEVVTDETSRTVAVNFCKKIFDKRGLGYANGESAECRKGDALRTSDSEFVARRLDEELAARPGYISLGESIRREHEAAYRKFKEKSTPIIAG